MFLAFQRDKESTMVPQMLRIVAASAGRVGFRAYSVPTKPPTQENLKETLQAALMRKSAPMRNPINKELGSSQSKIESPRIIDEGHNGALGGYAEDQPPAHIARIYQQQGWNRTAWKIDLANDSCWENNLLGPSYGDTLLPNVSMHMKFKSKEDAISFCEENNWAFEVDAPNKQ